MTSPTVTSRPSGPSFVADTSRVLINRAAEAGRLAEFVTQSTSQFVVLYGQPASGKSTLVKHWLIPALAAMPSVGRVNVYYGACTDMIPDVVQGAEGPTRLDEVLSAHAIVMVDEFDHVLDLPRDERRRQLDALFAKLKRKDCLAVVVAIVSERQLSAVYALTSYAPAIVSAVEPIGTVSLSDGLQRLCNQERAKRNINYSAVALATMEAEAKERGFDATFDFVKLIHSRFGALIGSDTTREIGADDYLAVGKLDGILREYIDDRIDAVEMTERASAPIAHAILLRVREAQTRAIPLDVTDIGPRLDVAQATVQRVLDLLVVEGLLLRTGGDQYQFQPPQVAVIVEADRATRQMENDRARRIVLEGVRSWQQLGTFLPTARFADVHRQRRSLTLDDEATRFVLQCALRQDQPDLADAAEYWLARIASVDDGTDVLLAALFDSSAAVRARSAKLLARFNDPLVRERLCVVALSDTDSHVRVTAIDSLERMPSDELLAALRREVDNPNSQHREQAVEALRLFPRADVIARLQSLVNDTKTPLTLREKAIAVLAALETTESVDALVGIALEDPDSGDREAAGGALARLRTEPLNRHLLDRLSWRRPVIRIVAMILLLSVLLYVSVTIMFFVVAFGAAAMGGNMVGRALFGLIALTVATGVLLLGLQDGRIKHRSVAGVIAAILFIISSVTYAAVLHGLASLMVRRTRRALTLFGLEMAGLAFFFVVAGVAETITGLGFLATVYRAIGVILFVASYHYDVLRVALDLFVMRGTMAREARRSAIYETIFANPVMTSTVIADVSSADVKVRRRARSLVRRFGDRMAPSSLVDRVTAAAASRRYVVSALARAKDDDAVAKLASMWTTATASTRTAIARTLARSPSAAAVQALSRLNAGGARLRLRAWWSKLVFSLDVWPRSAQIAVIVLLPVVGMLLYHGGMMTQNHAWGEIILLRQPISSPDRKVRIVDFLVDVYPDKSVDELRRLFESGQRKPIDPVHAAVTRGLVKILDSTDATHVDPLRRELTKEMIRFDTLLRSTDSAKFAMAIGVLGAMARSSDSTLANGAVQRIAAVADTTARVSSASPARLDSAVQALSRARYDRALPALARLLKALDSKKVSAKGDADVADLIQLEMNRVANQAFASLSPGDAEGRERLRQTLVAWLPGRTGSDLVEQLQKQTVANRCSGNAGPRCDAKSDALRVVEQSPETESGYRDLYRHFTADSAFHAAATEFTGLAARYPQSIWPRKILAEILHENLPAEPRSFARAYDEMIALRQLAAYQDLKTRHDADYRRVEADFAEIALSAGRSRELEAAAAGVVSGKATPSQRLNMALFLYIAAVIDRDPSASGRLTRLASLVDSLPTSFYNEWVYPGTRTFIQRSSIPDRLKSAVLELCREGDWYALTEARTIIGKNRRELGAVSVRSN